MQYQLRLLSCDGSLWHRYLGTNRFSGSVPSTVSVLTNLESLYALIGPSSWLKCVPDAIACEWV
jgi:hypothetical protein